MRNTEKSRLAFDEAKQYMPGGVNSPVRSFANVGGNPLFIARAQGSKIYDIDGNEYIDYVGSWGPMIAGHAHPQVVGALQEAVTHGTSYGAPTLLETELAKLVKNIYPSIEVIRMVNSGTEATMSALRLARVYTGRDKIVKFIGGNHGHSDSLLVSAGSGMATFGVPSSPGVTCGTAADTIAVPYNNENAIRTVMEYDGEHIAAVIVEPVAGNMGLVLPRQGYLSLLRELTEKHGTLLIFDEVMCGFRASLGGAPAAYGIRPDLTWLGKIIGGGLPVAAYGGRREIMEYISPAGPVYQAGTLSGNPLAMTAGIETLRILTAEPKEGKADYSRELPIKTKDVLLGGQRAAKDAGVPICAHQAGSMFGIFFIDRDVYDYDDAVSADQDAFRIWFETMLDEGIYLAPSQFETTFLSGAHTDEDIARTIAAAKKAFAAVKEKRS